MNRKPATRAPVGMEGLCLDGNGPVWRQIRRVILSRITSGAWCPGTRIPSEIELSGHFGVSRMTTNRAIQSLAVEGHLERHRRIGTLVAHRAHHDFRN